MSSTKQRHPLARAQDLAARLVAELAPACERIEVAGSVRRQTPTVGDVEIVAIPRYRDAGLFLGATPPVSVLFERLLALEIDRPRKVHLLKGDQKYRQYMVAPDSPPSQQIPLDLWIVTAETWGVQLAIRTGPGGRGEYSQLIVTEQCRGGLLRDGLDVHEGRVWSACERNADGLLLTRGPALDTPEEADFLALCGGWVDPQKREIAAAQHRAGRWRKPSAQELRSMVERSRV